MKNIKIGLQAHSVREAFAEDPIGTIKKVKEMGYTGLEIPMGAITNRNESLTGSPAEFYRKALEDEGMECYGILTSWDNIKPENLEKTIQYNKEIGSPMLVLGSVPTELVQTQEQVDEIIAYINEVHKKISAGGLVSGYHNHDTDFTNVVEGKTFFEHVFDNTPEDFIMLLDTGNAKAGGYDAIELLKKYPGRSPYLHIKGYSEEKGYLAYIGQDDYNWKELIECAINVGGSKVFDIEFGLRGDYDPMERAENGYNVIKNLLNEIE